VKEALSRSSSAALFSRALKVIPGGVNSPVRAFKAVGGEPLFIQRGSGSHVWDVDGNEYVDYVCSWGPLILGHANPQVVQAVVEAAGKGMSFGAPTEAEVELAEAICAAFPSIEQVRMVNSGTEAVMSAIRLARAFTGKEKVVKFEGCYHGHSDGLLVKAGSGATTLGIPDSAGVPAGFAQQTISVPFNDMDSLARALDAMGDEIACIVVEPVAGNMGVVPPKPGFLADLREVTHRRGIVLIFDEVITGFRVAYGGAQELYGVEADLTCLGKIIGGGMPVGAYGGRKEIMEMVAPQGPVYQAGTLSGNPVAMAAGLRTLKILAQPGPYGRLKELGRGLEEGAKELAMANRVPVRVNRVASMMTIFFTDRDVTDYASAKASDTARYATFFRALLQRGVYVAPSQFEAMFACLALSQEDLQATGDAAVAAFAEVRG